MDEKPDKMEEKIADENEQEDTSLDTNDKKETKPKKEAEKVVETKKVEGEKRPIISSEDIDFLNEVSITLSIEIGRAKMKIRELLNLSKDSVVDLNKNA